MDVTVELPVSVRRTLFVLAIRHSLHTEIYPSLAYIHLSLIIVKITLKGSS